MPVYMLTSLEKYESVLVRVYIKKLWQNKHFLIACVLFLLLFYVYFLS